MPTVYIVFDQLPKKKDGGLVATYINFVNQLKNDFDIKLVSVFSNGGNDIEAFNDVEVTNLSDYVLDNRFFNLVSYLKKGEIRAFFHAIASAFAFFAFIPIARQKTKKFFKGSAVVAVAPAAAMFISKKVKFILEIHTNFEYFWGYNPFGRMQSALAAKPVLTLFRNKTDAEKASRSFKSDYIYNGIKEPEFPDKNDPIERKRSSALYVGRLTSQKNPLRLIRCAKIVKDSIPDFSLDIYGTGEMEDALHEEISRLGLSDSVTLKGFTENKTVYAQYEQFWLTSEHEGFGLVLIEAMANKTPVVTTNWGDAVTEIVKDGITGYIANTDMDFSMKSVQLFNDPALQRKMGEAGYQDFKSRFSTDQNKRKWLEILRSTFGEDG